MVRITVDVPDADISKIDAEAEKKDLSRSKWAAIAIDAFLNQKSTISDAALAQLKEELTAKTQECDKLGKLSGELEKLSGELERTKNKLKEAGEDANKRWVDSKSIQKENDKLNNDIKNAQSTISQLQADLVHKQEEIYRIAKLKEELAVANNDRDRLKEALKVRDDDKAYYQSHISQLTQTIGQFSLPPGKEEAKKRSWWQLWRSS